MQEPKTAPACHPDQSRLGALLTRSLSRILVDQDLLKPDEDIRREQGTQIRQIREELRHGLPTPQDGGWRGGVVFDSSTIEDSNHTEDMQEPKTPPACHPDQSRHPPWHPEKMAGGVEVSSSTPPRSGTPTRPKTCRNRRRHLHATQINQGWVPCLRAA